jgi:hypothetical protein
VADYKQKSSVGAAGDNKMLQEQTNTVDLPSILIAKTYFWSPALQAYSRRKNEERRQAEVAAFFEFLGFEVRREDDHVYAEKDNITIDFFYRESCKNIYKRVDIRRDGKKSNITLIKKLLS